MYCYFAEIETFPPKLPSTVTPQIYLKMSADMNKFVFGAEANRYLREVCVTPNLVLKGEHVSQWDLYHCKTVLVTVTMHCSLL